jgi:3',5'-cyclic AMP phosphodiesterase CpdA
MKKIITFISDTHSKHHHCENDLPGGNILIHSGDFMNGGYSKIEVIEFLDWFRSIKGYDKKIFIAGNHDRILENDPTWSLVTIKDYTNLIYLQDEGYSIYDIDNDSSVKLYGSPWQPEFFNWAFNLPRNGEVMKAKWDDIPDDTDILITHGPPFGYLDIPGGQDVRVGCEMLRHRVDEIKPKIHVFGHIHGSSGYYYNGHTHFINASVLDERYNYTNLPVNVEWDSITNEIKWL